MNTANNLLNLMASFAAVVKGGSFTKAATRLGLSKSVVSRHVSMLEKAVGVQLMYRSTHRLSLTEAGERFHLYCKDLEHVAEQAAAFATAAIERPQGQLRITLPQTVAISRIGRLITRFQQAHPAVQLDVRVTSLQVDPIEEAFDLALRIGVLKDSNLICRRLCDVRFHAVAAPAYLKRHDAPRTPAELAAHNCLNFSEFESRSHWPVGKRGRATSALLTGNLNTNSGVLLVNAVLAGQGIAIGPDLMFEPYVTRRQLRIVLDECGTAPSGLYALYPPGRFASVNRRAFIDFLVEHLAAAAAPRAAISH